MPTYRGILKRYGIFIIKNELFYSTLYTLYKKYTRYVYRLYGGFWIGTWQSHIKIFLRDVPSGIERGILLVVFGQG